MPFCVFFDTLAADTLYMQFWERVKESIKLNRTTQEWVAKTTDIPFDTFRGWIAKDVMPKAHQAVAIARALGTTVELLVEGPADNALASWADQNRQLLDDLKMLAPEDLRKLALQVKALADDQRSQLGKDSASG
jgi:hypothetical protein